MKKIHITILEEDREYVEKLAFVMEQREREKLELAWYTCLENYRNDSREKSELILLGEAFQEKNLLEELKGEMEGRKVVLLSGDGVSQELTEYPVIGKYTSVDVMLRKIYSLMAEEIREDLIWPDRKMQVIGVYAPWNLELSMLFSFVLLQVLAEKERFLYVSLQECIGRIGQKGEEGQENLADFVSFLRLGKGSAQMRLKSICRKLGRGDCIPAADNPQNISEMNREDYRMMWEVLRNQTEYEGIIIEYGNAYTGMYEDMKQCRILYCPYQEDIFLANRREQMMHILKTHKAEELSERMQEIKLPKFACCSGGCKSEEQLVEELMCSEFGDTVRGVVSGYGR